MRVSNTHKHIWVGMLGAFLSAMLATYAAKPVTFAWLFAAGFFLVTLAWEAWQYSRAKDKNWYIKTRWLDTLIDIIAGNAAFNFVLWGWVMTYVKLS